LQCVVQYDLDGFCDPLGILDWIRLLAYSSFWIENIDDIRFTPLFSEICEGSKFSTFMTNFQAVRAI
jgi:hypothetical protein